MFFLIFNEATGEISTSPENNNPTKRVVEITPAVVPHNGGGHNVVVAVGSATFVVASSAAQSEKEGLFSLCNYGVDYCPEFKAFCKRMLAEADAAAAAEAAAAEAAAAEAAAAEASFSGVRAGLIYHDGVVVGELSEEDEEEAPAEEEVLINLTPHPINLIGDNGKVCTLPKSDAPARVEEIKIPVGKVNGVNIYNIAYGHIVNLPEPINGILYIVSRPVADAAGRADTLVVTDFVRDELGNITGAQSVARIV